MKTSTYYIVDNSSNTGESYFMDGREFSHDLENAIKFASEAEAKNYINDHFSNSEWIGIAEYEN